MSPLDACCNLLQYYNGGSYYVNNNNVQLAVLHMYCAAFTNKMLDANTFRNSENQLTKDVRRYPNDRVSGMTLSSRLTIQPSTIRIRKKDWL